MSSFAMAGGGTGGHIIPALAVARELQRRGHQPFFIGTRTGMEARLVPNAGFEMEWIEVGQLNRVGLIQKIRTLLRLPLSILHAWRILRRRRPKAVFSMGGYVSGPVMIAAAVRRLPIVIMEPNAVPGFSNRRMAKYVTRALVNFPQTSKYFPNRAEIAGVPVRDEFFQIRSAPHHPPVVLITGGSQGSRTLNRAAAGSWPLFRQSGLPIRIVHQAGKNEFDSVAREFQASGIEGEVVAFISDMPAAFAAADIVVCRAGASTVAELAAAGMPSILVPFPFAADDHQLRNAEAMVNAGAGRLVLDKDMNGDRLFTEVRDLLSNPGALESMSAKAREMAKPGAAARAVDVLEQVGMR